MIQSSIFIHGDSKLAVCYVWKQDAEPKKYIIKKSESLKEFPLYTPSKAISELAKKRFLLENL